MRSVLWPALGKLLLQALVLVAVTIALANLVGFLILSMEP